MSKSTPEKIVAMLMDNLINVDANKSCNLLYINSAIVIRSSALFDVYEWSNQFSFTVKKDEILFFKVSKPFVHIKHHFHYKLFEIDAIPSVMSSKGEGKYLKRMIFDAQFFSHQTWDSIQITGVGRGSG